MATKKSKKAAKKVTLTLDLDTLERLIDATAALQAPGVCLETSVDDPKVARKLKKRVQKKRKGS